MRIARASWPNAPFIFILTDQRTNTRARVWSHLLLLLRIPNSDLLSCLRLDLNRRRCFCSLDLRWRRILALLVPVTIASEIRISNRVHHFENNSYFYKFFHGIKALINSGQKNHNEKKYLVIPPFVLVRKTEKSRLKQNRCCIGYVSSWFFLITNGLFGCVLRSLTFLKFAPGKWLITFIQHAWHCCSDSVPL